MCGPVQKPWSLIRERHGLRLHLADVTCDSFTIVKCSYHLPSLAASGSLFWCLSHAWLGWGACRIRLALGSGSGEPWLWALVRGNPCGFMVLSPTVSVRSRNIVVMNSWVDIICWIFMDVSIFTWTEIRVTTIHHIVRCLLK